MLCVSRFQRLFLTMDVSAGRFLAARLNRVLELTPEGIHTCGDGYSRHVERTGQEAPGLRG